MLHDIGKVAVPDRILLKPGRFEPEEMELMKLHTTWGWEILQRADEEMGEQSFLTLAASIARYHHERYDGSGYPDGKTSSELHELSKIVSIADTYEAIAAPRAHRPSRNPHATMKQLIAETGSGKFDEDLVKVFLRCMSLYPIGSYVLLSSEQIAKVVAASPRSVTNPIVRVVQQSDGSKARFPLYIDLSTRDDVCVTGPYDP